MGIESWEREHRLAKRNGERDTRGKQTGTRVWERDARDTGSQALILDALLGVAPTVPWHSSGSSHHSGTRVLSFSSPGPGQALAGM